MKTTLLVPAVEAVSRFKLEIRNAGGHRQFYGPLLDNRDRTRKLHHLGTLDFQNNWSLSRPKYRKSLYCTESLGFYQYIIVAWRTIDVWHLWSCGLPSAIGIIQPVLLKSDRSLIRKVVASKKEVTIIKDPWTPHKSLKMFKTRAFKMVRIKIVQLDKPPYSISEPQLLIALNQRR